jgi:hypothetical protein
MARLPTLRHTLSAGSSTYQFYCSFACSFPRRQSITHIAYVAYLCAALGTRNCSSPDRTFVFFVGIARCESVESITAQGKFRVAGVLSALTQTHSLAPDSCLLIEFHSLTADAALSWPEVLAQQLAHST